MRTKNPDPALDKTLAELDPPYESNEERNIGRLLDQYGVSPFFYRQPTIIMDPQTHQNEIWKPAFTLPQYGGAVIDYVANAQHHNRMIQTYRYNQIPAAVLGPADLDKPCRPEDLCLEIANQLKAPEYALDQLLQS